MPSYVIDASVGIKWFVPEEYEEQAELLLAGTYSLLVPDLFYVEITNILWKRVRQNEIPESIARNILLALDTFVLTASSCASLSKTALEITVQTGCSVYDSMYVALAIRKKSKLVTADKKLFNTLSRGPLAKYVTLLENYPTSN